MMDFEVGAMNALKEEVPSVKIKGCHFHYSQSIWRKVQELGLVSHYINTAEIRQFIRRLMAMPFVPLGQVDEAFFISVAEVTWTAPITDLISYFTDTWLEEEALFTVDIWNHFSTDDNIRTNNNVEGWHSKLQKSGMSPKPNVYIFVNKMKEIEEENIAERRMLLCGSENPPQQKAVYKKVNDRLYSLKQRLLNQTISLRAYMDATTYIVKK
nr:uncharacterized protein LOC107456493 [Parasteatoda tepidariorum]